MYQPVAYLVLILCVVFVVRDEHRSKKDRLIFQMDRLLIFVTLPLYVLFTQDGVLSLWSIAVLGIGVAFRCLFTSKILQKLYVTLLIIFIAQLTFEFHWLIFEAVLLLCVFSDIIQPPKNRPKGLNKFTFMAPVLVAMFIVSLSNDLLSDMQLAETIQNTGYYLTLAVSAISLGTKLSRYLDSRALLIS